MTLQDWKKKIKQKWQWWPINRNALILLLLSYWLYPLLIPKTNKENLSDDQLPFIRLMGTFVAWFLFSIIALSVISTLFAWLYYRWMRQRKGSQIELQFTQEEKGRKKEHFAHLSIAGAIRPLLGFVQSRIFYDDGQMTEKIGLLGTRYPKKSLRRSAIFSQSRLELPYIKEYKIEGVLLFFEDTFRLISLPVFEHVKGHFYQSPCLEETTETKELKPKQSEQMDVRIEELRKVEGDYLHYKDFEAGDDVRRIVWKLYAKNRNLVVRMPERLEPYASKLNFYVSFYNSFNAQLWHDEYLGEMLNYYKNKVWSLYHTLQQQSWQLTYVPDQQFQLPEEQKELERVERIIGNSEWQNFMSLEDYYAPQKTSVLVISSLCSVNEVKHLLFESDQQLQVFYIKVSESLHYNQALHWLKRILFVSGNDRQSKMRSRWIFSPLRRQLLKNEKQIEQLFNNN